jgi:hypothetical protein
LYSYAINNIGYTGSIKVLEIRDFATQNWTITPVGLAGNETPSTIADQRWNIVLTGVVNVNLKGTSGQFLRETLLFRPDVGSAMRFAIQQYDIPIPPPAYGGEVPETVFQVEQYAPHATIGSTYHGDSAVNYGYAIDLWRLNPSDISKDIMTNAAINKIFAGLQVDVAVSGTDGQLYRLSYNINLIGRIRFRKYIAELSI